MDGNMEKRKFGKEEAICLSTGMALLLLVLLV